MKRWRENKYSNQVGKKLVLLENKRKTKSATCITTKLKSECAFKTQSPGVSLYLSAIL